MLYNIQASESKENFDKEIYLPIFGKVKYDSDTAIKKLEENNGGLIYNIKSKISYKVNYLSLHNTWLQETIRKDEVRFEGNIKEQYLADPSKCPFCKNISLDVRNDVEITERTIYKTIGCPICKEVWTEEFNLTNISLDDTK